MTEDEKNARIFKAFCDSNRLKILGLQMCIRDRISVRDLQCLNTLSLLTEREKV